ncbi:MAG TPA: ice-binding family protein [Frankiaceae bacterium]|nr:ice-binding family protein [Frankiaceae bacterium]
MTTSPTHLRRARRPVRRAGSRALSVGGLLLPVLLAFGALPAAAAEDPLATAAPQAPAEATEPAPQTPSPEPTTAPEEPAEAAATQAVAVVVPVVTAAPAPEPAPTLATVVATPPAVRLTTAPRSASPKAAAPAPATTEPSSAMAAAAEGSRLGTADNFAILAGSTITNSGRSVVTGDVGLHPGSAVTGFESCTGPANCVDLTGSMHVTDGAAQQAKADLLTAYNTLVGLEETCTSILVELGGTTLTPGVYCSPTFELTGTLTLSGVGEFIFLTGAGGSTLTTAAASQVLLIDGADSCGVYWQVASSAGIGAGSAFAGNILANTSISFGSGATLDGSALATDGAVTLIGNTITDSACGGAPPDSSPTPTPDGTGTPTPDGTGSPTPGGTGTPTPDGTGSPTPGDTGTPTPDDTGTPTPDDGTPPPDDGGTPAPDDDGTLPNETGSGGPLPGVAVGGSAGSGGTGRAPESSTLSRDGNATRIGNGLAATGATFAPHLLLAALTLGLGTLLVLLSAKPGRHQLR